MPNHTHSDLDTLKLQAEQLKNRKNAQKFLETDSETTRGTDTLVVFHAEELELLEGLILDVLGGEPITLDPQSRKNLINLYKHVKKE